MVAEIRGVAVNRIGFICNCTSYPGSRNHGLGGFPQCVQFSERQRRQVRATLNRQPLDLPEAPGKAIVGLAQRSFGIYGEPARQVDDNKQDVA